MPKDKLYSEQRVGGIFKKNKDKYDGVLYVGQIITY